MFVFCGLCLARDLRAKVVLLFGVCKYFSEKMQIFVKNSNRGREKSGEGVLKKVKS